MAGNRWVVRAYLQQGDEGYSETYYIQGVALDVVKGFQSDILLARQALLTDQAAIIGSTISDLDVPRSSFPFDPSTLDFPLTGNFVPTAPGIMPADVCVLLKEYTAAGKFGTRHIHSVPRECVTDPGIYTPSTAWLDLMNTFIGKLTTECWLATKTPGPPTTYALQEITDVSQERLSNRKVGRPFGLPRGRAIVA